MSGGKTKTKQAKNNGIEVLVEPPDLAENRIDPGNIPKEIRAAAASSKRRQIIADDYPYPTKLSRPRYEAQKRELQVELLKMQHWAQDRGERVVVLFEGRDAAGKGGTIKRFNEHLNPRNARIVALGKPTEREQGQWFFQRYIEQLPSAGELVFFDRSWYNRAVVEPVMGFCTQSQHHAFLRQVPMFENMLIDDGIHLLKFWFSVSRAEQYRRFRSREKDTLKQWKLSPVDTQGLAMWDQYTEAKKSMFMATDTRFAPWTVVKSDDKKRARLACMRHLLNVLPYEGKDPQVVGHPDPAILGRKEDIYENDEW